MMPGMTMENYMANFNMLTGRTGFNEVALEDAYIWGLSQSILLKVYSQTSLPSGMDSWKVVVRNLDPLQRGYSQLKQSIQLNRAQLPKRNSPTVTQTPDKLVPMD